MAARSGTPTLGLFVGTTDDANENLLIRGVWEAAQDFGARFVCFNSGAVSSPHGFEAMRTLYDGFCDGPILDAHIMSWSVNHHSANETFTDFCRHYKTRPVVTLAIQLPGIPCVQSDNRGGMSALMDHLLDVHGYRKIAFIGGPEGYQEADLRRAVFLEKLAEKGVSPPESWLVSGDFSEESGFQAMEHLLSGGTLPFEGVVAANDYMAFGAHRALTLCGYQVPRDLFLTGFDDIQESRFHNPPLTTVRQFIEVLAKQAVNAVLRTGSGTPPLTLVPTELSVRGSCGCVRWAAPSGGFWDPSLLLAEGEISRRRLSDTLDQALVGNKDEVFFAELHHVLEEAPSSGLDAWQAGLSLIRSELQTKTLTAEQRAFGEGLLHEARRLVADQVLRRDVLLRLRAEELAGRVIACAEALATSYSLDSILTVLRELLPPMGLRGAWLSLLDGGSSEAPVLALAFDQWGASEVPRQAFRGTQLVPGGLAELDSHHKLLVVEVLASQHKPLGLVVFSTDIEGARISGSLRSQISGAIRGVRLLEENQRAEHQLLQSEKLAALGNLVAGVAHEINTPLGVAVSAASYLKSLSVDFQKLFEAQQIRKSDLEIFVARVVEAGDLVVSNLGRAAELVASFKQVAADQASENRRSFALKEYLEETLVSLKPQWKNRPLTLNVRGPSNLAFDSYPGAIAQIVTNLLINALVHAFAPEQSGTIDIRVEDRGRSVCLKFADDGQGVAPENLPHIFEPFYTTKRGQGGTGLGLQIVHNLVTKVLGGTVTCTSKLGQGTVFEMTLPKMAPVPSIGPVGHHG